MLKSAMRVVLIGALICAYVAFTFSMVVGSQSLSKGGLLYLLGVPPIGEYEHDEQ